MSHRVVSPAEWQEARRDLLAKEKEFTRARDELGRLRRELPWERVEKSYAFDGARGRQTLAELFDGRSQLVVYHFMFAPAWEAGCPHCSFWADSFNGVTAHLHQRDVTMLAVSRAPYPKLAAYAKRMGWSFTWVSSGASDFNFDLHVSFSPETLAAGDAVYNYRKEAVDEPEREGISVFHRDPEGAIFHTYSTYARGIDLMNTAYNYLDLVPKGRDEGDQGQSWVRRRDEYGR